MKFKIRILNIMTWLYFLKVWYKDFLMIRNSIMLRFHMYVLMFGIFWEFLARQWSK